MRSASGTPRSGWRRIGAGLLLVGAGAFAADEARHWTPLASDGIHDPANPGLTLLQEPAEALVALPADTAGNQVRWVQAIEQGILQPRSAVDGIAPFETRDTEVLLRRTGEMPMVLFPHKAHTAWLDCSNCHDALFARQAGATPITMLQILRGERCGLCHGAVSFPLTECNRCHSVERSLGPQPRDTP